jgi:hypothetical protein
MVVRLPATIVGLAAIAILLVRHERAARDRRIAETCRGWQQAIAEIEALHGSRTVDQKNSAVLEDALSRSDMDFLWTARLWLAEHPTDAPKLVPFLAAPVFVGLTNYADVRVEDREMPSWGHGYVTWDDLFTRSGRASWLLHVATGRKDVPHAVVGTNRIILADIAKDWQAWFDDLDGGRACFGSPSP